MIYHMDLVKGNDIQCRALVDTGSGSTYAPASLIKILNQKPSRVETKMIEMMLHLSNIYNCDFSVKNLYFREKIFVRLISQF